MRFSTIFTATALAGSALAADHTVVVGKDGLSFVPNVTTAAKGDTVTFKFWPKNHSIAQGAFAKPCEPLANGFWSGFVPTTDTAKAASETFMYTVQNASAPVWFYCTQGSHCQSGMVGVINPPSSGANTIEKYAADSKSASSNVSPSSKASDNPGFGMLMNGTTMPSSTTGGTTQSTGAAANVNMNGVALTGFMGMITYMLM
ncbi:Cupredoxin [Melanomma pulvis-pyrius CBS 109.77]|uniref:Cupredoxin n=1 Tax=Melanomma pulvis-pyrius CBS 109.77 TaxID=1314802 RepID=A0A6A6WWH4_9PLEO|nr:Cupredoxin [Melanomma pulvis-pyrius CBS 109.77]